MWTWNNKFNQKRQKIRAFEKDPHNEGIKNGQQLNKVKVKVQVQVQVKVKQKVKIKNGRQIEHLWAKVN